MEYALRFGEYCLILAYEPMRRLLHGSYWVRSAQVERPAPSDEVWELIAWALVSDARLWLRLPTGQGTQKELRTWQAIYQIPYGRTASYSQIARALGNKANQAVGQACKRNTYPWLIPCHRVIYQDGRIGHYSGGDAMKPWLLDLERNYTPQELIFFLQRQNG